MKKTLLLEKIIIHFFDKWFELSRTSVRDKDGYLVGYLIDFYGKVIFISLEAEITSNDPTSQENK